MLNANKGQGNAHEAAVQQYLTRALPVPALKPNQNHFADVGDLWLGPFTLQLKSSPSGVKKVTDYLMDAREQAARAGLPFGAAVIKNHNAPGVDADLVVIDLETFAILLTTFIEHGEPRA